MFDSPGRLLLGLATGIAFGFLLQKGRVTKYPVIVGQFLLRDFTVVKTMLTAVVVGGIGIYAFKSAGWVNLHVKPALLVATAAGGLIFGVGMAILGLCPGTAVGAAGEGNRHARWGLLGMLVGAGLYAESHGVFSRGLLKLADFGKATLPGVTGIGAGWLLAALGALAGVAFWLIERWERRPVTRTPPRAAPKAVEANP